MKKIKIGDIVQIKSLNEYGLIVDKHKLFGETQSVEVFLFNKHNHGERLKNADINDVKFIGHSYDFDSLRSTLPKKLKAILK